MRGGSSDGSLRKSLMHPCLDGRGSDSGRWWADIQRLGWVPRAVDF